MKTPHPQAKVQIAPTRARSRSNKIGLKKSAAASAAAAETVADSATGGGRKSSRSAASSASPGPKKLPRLAARRGSDGDTSGDTAARGSDGNTVGDTAARRGSGGNVVGDTAAHGSADGDTVVGDTAARGSDGNDGDGEQADSSDRELKSALTALQAALKNSGAQVTLNVTMNAGAKSTRWFSFFIWWVDSENLRRRFNDFCSGWPA